MDETDIENGVVRLALENKHSDSWVNLAFNNLSTSPMNNL